MSVCDDDDDDDDVLVYVCIYVCMYVCMRMLALNGLQARRYVRNCIVQANSYTRIHAYRRTS